MRDENTGDVLVYDGEVQRFPNSEESWNVQGTAFLGIATRRFCFGPTSNGESSV